MRALSGIPSAAATLAPGRAPVAKPSCSSAARNAGVRRAATGAKSGRRSTKIRCGHASFMQRKRRAWRRTDTGLPPQG